jgi:hypothetical protein
MKTYYYEVNKFIKGVTEAKNRRDAKRYCKRLTKMFCPNAKIKSVKITKIKNSEPLAVEA